MFHKTPHGKRLLPPMEQIVYWQLTTPSPSAATLQRSEPDFSEYMWMEHMEEFDKMEMKRLEEEHCMRECIAAMMADEIDERLTQLEKAAREAEWKNALMQLPIMELDVANSQLNPLANEFVPNVVCCNEFERLVYAAILEIQLCLLLTIAVVIGMTSIAGAKFTKWSLLARAVEASRSAVSSSCHAAVEFMFWLLTMVTRSI